jgi:hypothetical protein
VAPDTIITVFSLQNISSYNHLLLLFTTFVTLLFFLLVIGFFVATVNAVVPLQQYIPLGESGSELKVRRLKLAKYFRKLTT